MLWITATLHLLHVERTCPGGISIGSYLLVAFIPSDTGRPGTSLALAREACCGGGGGSEGNSLVENLSPVSWLPAPIRHPLDSWHFIKSDSSHISPMPFALALANDYLALLMSFIYVLWMLSYPFISTCSLLTTQSIVIPTFNYFSERAAVFFILFTVLSTYTSRSTDDQKPPPTSFLQWNRGGRAVCGVIIKKRWQLTAIIDSSTINDD